MTTRAAKTITDRQQASRHLLADIEHHLRQASRAPASRHTPAAHHPETLLRAADRQLLTPLATWLEASITPLVRLDDTVYTQNARLRQARQERDDAIRHLAKDISRLRRSIESQYQAPEIRRLGFQKTTPRHPEPLLRLAHRVATNLASPELPHLLGTSWYRHPFDPSTHRDELAAHVDEAEQLVRQADELEYALDRLLINRRQAMEEHDRVFREVGRVFEALRKLGEKLQQHAGPADSSICWLRGDPSAKSISEDRQPSLEPHPRPRPVPAKERAPLRRREKPRRTGWRLSLHP